MLAVGLMSGTSLDGVDAALVDVSGEGMGTSARLVAFDTLPMPAATRARIMRVCDPKASSTPLLCSLNVELGHLFADAARAVCAKASVSPDELSFVASHGQTVWHARPRPSPAPAPPTPPATAASRARFRSASPPSSPGSLASAWSPTSARWTWPPVDRAPRWSVLGGRALR